MGLVGYYKRFIKKLSRVAYPTTSFQMKGTKFVWNNKCGESFQRMKQLLTIAPILKITYPYGEFVVCTNASKEGVDGVLLQDDFVV